jgi:hypothetical protein
MCDYCHIDLVYADCWIKFCLASPICTDLEAFISPITYTYGGIHVCNIVMRFSCRHIDGSWLTSAMQKNWLIGWVLGKPQMLNPLNLVLQMMEILNATWFCVKGNVLTTFRKSTKALEGVHNESSVMF